MTVYTPSFTAANSTTAVPNFTNRINAMGINTNSAYPATTGSDGAATYNTAMGSDDVTVTVTVGTLSGSGSDFINLFLGCSTGGDAARANFALSGSNTSCQIWTGTTGNWFSISNFIDSTSTAPPYTTGTDLTFMRVGNVYTVKVGSTTALMWTDSSNTVPRDSSHRLVGIGGINTSGNYRRISAMTATDALADVSTTNFFAMF